MNNDQLRRLAEEYINDVNKIGILMLERLGFKSRSELLKHGHTQWKGEFKLNGKNNMYCFHGRGCRFSNDELEIDWDFGYEDNIWCGLDPWKLFYYMRDNKKSNEFRDGDQIKKTFEELVSKGKMIKKYGLYYYS